MKRYSTFIISLTLQHDEVLLTCGLCFSRLSLRELKSMRRDFLHPKEQAYFNTLQYPKRQYSYLLGRYCAKKALSACSNRQHHLEILIENGVFQQPIVYCLNHNNPQVSISHTEKLGAAIAFLEAYPMAIDIETINNSTHDAICTFLTAKEQELACSLSSSVPLQLFWTIKEALSKVLRCGLTVPFELLEIESIIRQETFFISYFKHFPQYKVLSFLLSEEACSIVYPKNTQLDIDILTIQEKMGFCRIC